MAVVGLGQGRGVRGGLRAPPASCRTAWRRRKLTRRKVPSAASTAVLKVASRASVSAFPVDAGGQASSTGKHHLRKGAGGLPGAGALGRLGEGFEDRGAPAGRPSAPARSSASARRCCTSGFAADEEDFRRVRRPYGDLPFPDDARVEVQERLRDPVRAASTSRRGLRGRGAGARCRARTPATAGDWARRVLAMMAARSGATLVEAMPERAVARRDHPIDRLPGPAVGGVIPSQLSWSPPDRRGVMARGALSGEATLTVCAQSFQAGCARRRREDVAAWCPQLDGTPRGGNTERHSFRLDRRSGGPRAHPSASVPPVGLPRGMGTAGCRP